jgi:hypothetical protein
MSIQAVQPGVEPTRPDGGGDRDQSRVLRLLEANQRGGLTVAVLRECGVGAPALTVYELQLAGYEIDRVPFRCSDGHTTLGYRLRTASAPADRSARSKEVGSDDV